MLLTAIDETWSLKTELKQIFFSGQSDFQKVQVIETAAFGRTLVSPPRPCFPVCFASHHRSSRLCPVPTTTAFSMQMLTGNCR